MKIKTTPGTSRGGERRGGCLAKRMKCSGWERGNVETLEEKMFTVNVSRSRLCGGWRSGRTVLTSPEAQNDVDEFDARDSRAISQVTERNTL